MRPILGEYLWRNLGHCPSCMRSAFVYAAIAASGALLSILLDAPFSVTMAIGICTLFLLSLWLLHIACFALKLTKRKRTCLSSPLYSLNANRREVLVDLAKTCMAAATLTALPAAAQFIKVGYPACPDNNYSSSRRGFGACQQECRSAKDERFPCPKGTRPIYLNNGECTCCPFPECT